MKKAYVFGPYRAKTVYEVRQNIRFAEDVTVKLLKKGYNPYCPHKNFGLLDGAVPEEIFLYAGLDMLAICDIAVGCPAWEDSEGSLGEVQYCKDNNILIYNLVEDVPDVGIIEVNKNPHP